jgi:hypothetical protein
VVFGISTDSPPFDWSTDRVSYDAQLAGGQDLSTHSLLRLCSVVTEESKFPRQELVETARPYGRNHMCLIANSLAVSMAGHTVELVISDQSG